MAKIFEELVSKAIGGSSSARVDDNVIDVAQTSSVDLQKFINSLRNYTRKRLEKKEEYDTMALDSVIGSALELYADDMTQPDRDKGKIVWVESENLEISDYINNFLKEVNADTLAWPIAYNVAKYGECFLKTYYSDINMSLNNNMSKKEKDILKSKKGFIYEIVQDPYLIVELDKWGDNVGYASLSSENIKKDDYLSEPNKEKIDTIYPVQDYVHFINDRGVDRTERELSHQVEGKVIKETYTIREGTSFLETSVGTHKILEALEDMLITARFERSNKYQIFSIEVGNSSNIETVKILREFKVHLSSQEAKDIGRGTYTQSNKPVPLNNNIYNPVRNGKGQLTVDSIGGDVDIKDIVDIEYWRNKLFAGLKIPKAYLGFEECFRYSTKVVLCNGTVEEIGKMSENPDLFLGKEIFTCSSDGRVKKTKIAHIKLTRKNAVFVRVKLSNGKYIDVTPDHKMMLLDGHFVKACSLTEGSKLMSRLDEEKPFIYVKSVERLDSIEDAYDLGVSSDNHTFLTDSGIFVHNSMPGGIGDQTLVRYDIRFARTIKRGKNTLYKGFTDMINTHLDIIGKQDYIGKFDVKMAPILSAEESDRRDQIQTDINLADSIKNLLMDVNSSGVTNDKVIEYIIKYVLKFTELSDLIYPPKTDKKTEKNLDIKDLAGK